MGSLELRPNEVLTASIFLDYLPVILLPPLGLVAFRLILRIVPVTFVTHW